MKLASLSMLKAAASLWPTARERQLAAIVAALDEHAQRDLEAVFDAMVGAVRAERKMMAGVLLATSTQDDVSEAAEEMGISVDEFRRIAGGGK